MLIIITNSGKCSIYCVDYTTFTIARNIRSTSKISNILERKNYSGE